MSRNYRNPLEIRRAHPDLDAWAEGRETHVAVATAIHAIADATRDPEAIWADPTDAEVDHVTMAVDEYVHEGDFEAESDDRYPWGEEFVTLAA